ncbi:MAG TPA: hypothetical protein VN253_06990 [Kofleriaceae bacterium]|nr:hypothetical protein [Kofleriaceae bacterium]
MWRGLIDGTLTPATYMHQLVRVYGFEAPLEAALAYTPDLPLELDVRGRARSGFIVRDLLALGISAAAIAELPQGMIAPFHGAGEALGWLYVAERCALAHDGIRLDIVGRFPRLEGATSYLGSAEEARWISFVIALERFARTRALQQQVASGACEGFRHAVGWLHGCEAAVYA